MLMYLCHTPVIRAFGTPFYFIHERLLRLKFGLNNKVNGPALHHFYQHRKGRLESHFRVNIQMSKRHYLLKPCLTFFY